VDVREFRNIYLAADVDLFTQAIDLAGANAATVSTVAQNVSGDLVEVSIEFCNDLQNWSDRTSLYTVSMASPFAKGKSTGIAFRYCRLVVNANGGSAMANLAVKVANL
jgi:hypothetical protein